MYIKQNIELNTEGIKQNIELNTEGSNGLI